MIKKIIGKILSKRGKRNLPPSYLAPNLRLLHYIRFMSAPNCHREMPSNAIVIVKSKLKGKC